LEDWRKAIWSADFVFRLGKLGRERERERCNVDVGFEGSCRNISPLSLLFLHVVFAAYFRVGLVLGVVMVPFEYSSASVVSIEVERRVSLMG